MILVLLSIKKNAVKGLGYKSTLQRNKDNKVLSHPP